ncbi:hypothetical protein FRC12_015816 [Ceratobasidium sp. 428]|nr:hypothetical protein FRC12_015816 [Ceratobasidium sp. 428]
MYLIHPTLLTNLGKIPRKSRAHECSFFLTQAGPSSLPIFPSSSSASTFESWAPGSERAFEGYATAAAPPAPASAPPAPAPASAPASVHVPPAPASANPGDAQPDGRITRVEAMRDHHAATNKEISLSESMEDYIRGYALLA